MLARLRQRLTYANVMATIAVFIALGGSGYAAVTLEKNSVKGKHIAKNAVTSLKVKNRSLKRKDFAAGQLPRGPQGLQGPQGLKGDQGLPGPGEEVAIRYNAVNSSPTTNRTRIFSGDGLIVDASCNANLTLWAGSTNGGSLTFTKILESGGTDALRDPDLDPIPYAFNGVVQNDEAGGTISWTTPTGTQLSGSWHGNGSTATAPCRFDALLLRHP